MNRNKARSAGCVTLRHTTPCVYLMLAHECECNVVFCVRIFRAAITGFNDVLFEIIIGQVIKLDPKQPTETKQKKNSKINNERRVLWCQKRKVKQDDLYKHLGCFANTYINRWKRTSPINRLDLIMNFWSSANKIDRCGNEKENVRRACKINITENPFSEPNVCLCMPVCLH